MIDPTFYVLGFSFFSGTSVWDCTPCTGTLSSLTVRGAFCKIFLFDSILFISECDGGPMRGKVTTHTLKIWRETRFVKPIPIYDTFIILVKRYRWQHVVTDPWGHGHRTAGYG